MVFGVGQTSLFQSTMQLVVPSIHPSFCTTLTITGLTLEGHVGGFTGVVQSVGHDVMRDKSSRYQNASDQARR
jgi:hypothetical protein